MLLDFERTSTVVVGLHRQPCPCGAYAGTLECGCIRQAQCRSLAVGLAILACLGNGFNQLNLSTYLQDIITGVLVLLALGLERVLVQMRRKRSVSA